MKRTMVWPPVLIDGAAQMTPDPVSSNENEALAQLVVMTVQDAGSMHPWLEQIKLGVQDRAFKGAKLEDRVQLEGDIRERFGRLERARRARLVGLHVDFKDGQLNVDVTYEDLETGGRRNMGVSLNG